MNVEMLRYAYLRRVVGTGLQAVGLDASLRLATGLARRVFNLDTLGRRRAQDRVAAALGRTTNDEAVVATVASMYEHVGRFWIEALFARRLLKPTSWRKRIRVHDAEALLAARQKGRGCLLATAYCGNPAAGILALGRLLRPVHVLVDFLAQPYLRAWQDELYADRDVRPIDRAAAARELPNVLQDGGTVVLIAEHERRRGKGVPVDFLGRRMRCYPTVARLARLFEVPVGAFTCRRDRRAMSFQLSFHVWIEPRALAEIAHADIDRGDIEYDNINRGNVNSGGIDSGGLNSGGIDRNGIDRADRDLVRRVMAALDRAIMEQPDQYLWSLPTSPASSPPRAKKTPRRIRKISAGASASSLEPRRARSA